MDFASLGFKTATPHVKGIAVSTITAGKTLSVTINGTTVTARAARDLTVAIGDVVVLMRADGELIAVARLFSAAPAIPDADDPDLPPPPKPPGSVSGTTVITPVETRSYRTSVFTGWRTDNDSIYQGQFGGNGLHIGCAFYGDKPRSLRGVVVTSATIRAYRLSGGDFAKRQTTLRRIEQKRKPSGAPTLIAGSWDGPNLAVKGQSSSIALPDSWGQDLVDQIGSPAGGLAIYVSDGSPYVRLAGRQSWAQAFTLTIKWRRDA